MCSNTKTSQYASELEKTSNYATDDPKSMTKHYLPNYIETTQKAKHVTMSLNVEFFSSYDTFPLQHSFHSVIEW